MTAGSTTPHPKKGGEEDDGDGDSAEPSLKSRLVAWWEGYETPARKQKKADAKSAKLAKGSENSEAPAPAKPGMNRFGKPLWTASRLEVAEQIWGVGYSSPGGDEVIAHLAKPLGLNPAMTVIEIGCGLGGATRCIAKQFGSWVVGLEASPFLAEQGMLRSTKAGAAKQAAIQLFDPEDVKYAKRVDAVFSKEAFFTIRNKDGLFDRVQAMLKPRGQFLITDYVITPEGRNHPIVKAWADREPLEPQLWTLEGAIDAFTQCNFDLRVQEDVTGPHLAQIMGGIRALTEHLEKHHLDKDTKINVLDEVETWAQRIAALQAGLRCYRFYALKPPE